MRIAISGILLAVTSMVPGKCADLRSNAPTEESQPSVCSNCIRANMEFLASDTMRGRGCGTQDEHVAAVYLENELRQYGIIGGMSGGAYQQEVKLITPRLAAPPVLEFSINAGQTIRQISWTHGAEILVVNPSLQSITGPLQKLDDTQPQTHAQKGAVVFYRPVDIEKQDAVLQRLHGLLQDGAIAILLPPRQSTLQRWRELGGIPKLPTQVAGPKGSMPEQSSGTERAIVRLSLEAANILAAEPDGEALHLEVKTLEPVRETTYNVVGVLRGSNDGAKAILLTAHYDHLGIGPPVNGDSTYNGADDDASGTTAVLEFARQFAHKRSLPQRTTYFVLYGCEERGALGSAYFGGHPPVPLNSIGVNLEFEMIGTQDPKLPKGSLLLTGWERSNLGATLQQHGARLAADPYPEERLFQRSDNYQLALRSVVAHTAGSAPIMSFYHRPDDDLQHIEWNFMIEVIQSLIRPLEWLANSDFQPQWNPGMAPKAP